MKNVKFVAMYLRNWSLMFGVRGGMEALEEPVDISQLIYIYINYFFS